MINNSHPHRALSETTHSPPVHPNHHWTEQLDDVDLTIMSGGAGSAIVDYIDTNFLASMAAATINGTLNGLAANSSDPDGGHNYTCASLEMTFAHRILMSLYTIVFIGGILGNMMIIYTVFRCQGMQTVTNRYILNLAIADECFLIGLPFLIITMNVGDWMFGPWMCKAYMVSTSITQFTSSLFLLIMSADRYVAICHHISSPRYRTPNVSRALSAFAWLVSAALIWPIIWYANLIDRGDGRFTCTVVWPRGGGNVYGMSFTLYTFLFAFLLPLIFILVFYGAVLLKLRRVSRRTQTHQQQPATNTTTTTTTTTTATTTAAAANQQQPQQRTKSKARHRKVTRLVMSVVAVYVCCWLPYWIGQVTLILTPDRMCRSRLELVLYLATGTMGYMNSAINPVLYAFLSETFRKSLMRTVPCLRWCVALWAQRVGGGGGNGSGTGGVGGGVGGRSGGGMVGGGGGGGMSKGCVQQRSTCATGLGCDVVDERLMNGRRTNGEEYLLGDGGVVRGKRMGGAGGEADKVDAQLGMVARIVSGGGKGIGCGGGKRATIYIEANTATTVTGLSSSRNPSPTPPLVLQLDHRNGGGGGGGSTVLLTTASAMPDDDDDDCNGVDGRDYELVPLSTAA